MPSVAIRSCRVNPELLKYTISACSVIKFSSRLGSGAELGLRGGSSNAPWLFFLTVVIRIMETEKLLLHVLFPETLIQFVHGGVELSSFTPLCRLQYQARTIS